MSLKRSHILYLQSKHREYGTTSQYVISLPEIIESDANLERFKISLLNFTTYNDWYLIKDGADTITINGVETQIPHGTYTYQNLARTLQTYTNAVVTWNSSMNIMTFTFTTSKTISFDGLGTILGFDVGVNYTGSSISSVRAMTPYDTTHIIIHLNNISSMVEHLCMSNHTGEVRLANILGKVLINASPFQLIEHQQVLESDGLYSNDNSLGTLEFMITDNDGNLFTDIGEHELVLRIEAVDYDDYVAKDMIDELKQIRITMKDLLMYKVIGRSRY
jgi:hypothetical protein